MEEHKKNIIFASSNEVSISPRKIRLVVNLVKNKEIQEALDILKYSKKHQISLILRKLLLSALSNWNKIYKNILEKDSNLYIGKIVVNQGKTLKRLRPVPQGRGNRIRKRSSKILVVLEKR